MASRQLAPSLVAFSGGVPLFRSGAEGADLAEPLQVEIGLTGNYSTRGFSLTQKHFEEMIANHRASGVDPAVDREHESWFSSSAQPALGWVRSLSIQPAESDKRRSALVAEVHLNDLGQKAVKNGHFRYVSMGFDKAGKNRQTGESIGAVLDHLALVKNPFIQGMRPLSLALSASLGRLVEEEEGLAHGDPTKAESEFASMMVPHHEAAIEMSNALIESGSTDDVLVGIAKNILKSQSEEISTLNEWMSEHGVTKKKGKAMSELHKKMRADLGLSADASEDQIIAAFTAQRGKEQAEAEALKQLDEQKRINARLESELEKLSKADAERADKEWLSTIDQAVKDFRLTPAEVDEHKALTGAERTVAARLLAKRTPMKPAAETVVDASANARKGSDLVAKQDEALAAYKAAHPGVDDNQVLLAVMAEKPQLFGEVL